MGKEDGKWLRGDEENDQGGWILKLSLREFRAGYTLENEEKEVWPQRQEKVLMSRNCIPSALLFVYG